MPPLALVWDLIAKDNASPAFARVGAAASKAAHETEAAQTRMSQSLAKVALGVTAAGVGIAAVSVKMASDFQASMLQVQTQAGASAAEIKKMTPAILSLAGKTAQAPEALATSLYHVESVGLRGAKALNVVAAAAKFATVAHADLEETTNALTATVASGIPGIKNMDQAIGMLNATVGSGDMKLSDLNDALGSGLLTVVKGYGLNMRDVSAALATFGDNNIRGADAATMLRMAVQSMAVPAKGGKKALEELGLTASTLAKDMQTGGLNKAITDLNAHIHKAGITGVQVGDILTQAFGKKAGPGVAVLSAQFDRLQTKYADVNKATNTFGKEWDATTKSAQFQAKALGANVQALAISFGNQLLPAVTGAMSWMNTDGIPAIKSFGSGVGDLIGWFKSLPAPIREVALGFAALKLAMSFGPVEAGLGRAKLAFQGFREEMALQQSLMAMNARSTAGMGTQVRTLAGEMDSMVVSSGRTGGALSKLGSVASTTAIRGMSALKAAGSGLMSMFGGPWGLALAGAALGVTALMNAVKQHNDAVRADTQQVTDWYKAIHSGGQPAIDAATSLRNKQQDLASAQAKLNDLTSNSATIYAQAGRGAAGYNAAINYQKQKVSDLSTEVKKGKEDWDAYWKSLSPQEQIAQTVAADEANLALAIQRHGAASRDVSAASATYNADLEKQKQLSVALTTAEQSQIDKLNALATAQLGSVSSTLAADQAQSQLADSVAQYAADAKDGMHSSKALDDESRNLAQQAIQTAQAVAKGKVDQMAANGVTDDGTVANATMLASLKAAAAQITGPGHAALMTAINDLQKTTIAHGNLSDAVKKMSADVNRNWDANTVVLNTATAQQIRDLKALGYSVTTLPNGKVVVTSDTRPAVDEINKMLAYYRHQALTLQASLPTNGVTAGAGPARAAFASGGLFRGAGTGTSDSNLVAISDHEFIVNAAATQANLGLLHAINSGAIKGFAAGGLVGGNMMQVGTITPTVHMDTTGVGNQIAALIAHIKATLIPAMSGVPSSVSGNAAIVQRLAAGYGWGSGSEWQALYNVIMRESGFRNTAQNPTSTAYGMFQFLDSTWGGYGVGKTSDPTSQAIAGLRYIASRYSDPLGAYRHEQNFGWYDNGGWLKPGLNIAMNGTGKPERVRTAEQEAALGGGSVNVRVFVGNREISDIARVEVDRALGQVADSVHYAGSGH